MLVRSAALALILPSVASAQLMEMISRSPSGAPGDGPAVGFGYSASISPDGRELVFSSDSTNLVAGDTNGAMDVFLYDCDASAAGITLLSRGIGGVPADGPSVFPTLSQNGRFVAFLSQASNLVPDDTNNAVDAFVCDRLLGTYERINVDSAEEQSVGFWFFTTQLSMTRNGRYVVFDTDAGDLVPGDLNGVSDVFMRDRLTGTTTRLYPSAYQAKLTPDGRYLTFTTNGALLPGDFNNTDDVYVRDLGTNALQRVSVSSQGVEGNGPSFTSNISPNGRFVVFKSSANNLVSGDVNFSIDIFLRDRALGTTERVSVSSQEVQANNDSYEGWITEDGRYVYFGSAASNLVAHDLNGAGGDVFVRDRRRGTTTRIVVAEHDFGSGACAMTPDGIRTVLTDRLTTVAPVQFYLRTLPPPDPHPIF